MAPDKLKAWKSVLNKKHHAYLLIKRTKETTGAQGELC